MTGQGSVGGKLRDGFSLGLGREGVKWDGVDQEIFFERISGFLDCFFCAKSERLLVDGFNI